MGYMKKLRDFLCGKQPTTRALNQNCVQWRVLQKLKEQGTITNREIVMMGTNHPTRLVSRLRKMGFVHGHLTAPNANGKGEHRVYMWSGK